MSAVFPLIAQGGFSDGHMGGWGWLAIATMVVMMGGMGWMMWSMMRGASSNGNGLPEDPVAVLKARYARGELTTEEFQERLRTIEDTRR
jgi:uncharacterized membrane protein